MLNHPTIADIMKEPLSEVSALPIDQLEMLFSEAKAMKSTAETASDFLRTVIAHKYDFEKAYADKGTTLGAVNISDGDFVIQMVTPPRYSWDQIELAKIEKIVREDWGHNPEEYIDTSRKISETKFKAWPSDLKAVFEHARSVFKGKPTIKISMGAK